MEWFIDYRPHLVAGVCPLTKPGEGGRLLLAIPTRERLVRVMERMLDPAEFLSDYGLRSLSRFHARSPYMLEVENRVHNVAYEPADSTSDLFGGNSNWRGPVWFPVNYLMIESLRKYHHYYGDSLQIELPTGSGQQATLAQIATDLGRRLERIFLRDGQAHDRRPVFGSEPVFQNDPHWRDHLLFFEYFHGDTGAGLGASHQTGWTALVANLIRDCGERR
jgi:hypothetical protein